MILGLTVEKLLVIGAIVAMILGPERLPRYAAMLAQFAGRAREYVNSAKGRLREEVGDDVDWRSLDPRQYDPRRIMRQALLVDTPVIARTPVATLAAKRGGSDDDDPQQQQQQQRGVAPAERNNR